MRPKCRGKESQDQLGWNHAFLWKTGFELCLEGWIGKDRGKMKEENG